MTSLHPAAYLELTFNCTHACRFCSRPWLSHPELYAPELSISDWKRVLCLLGDWGVRDITFTGGEPLLKDGCMELFEEAVKMNCFDSICVFTNGDNLTEEYMAFFANHGIRLAVSLPGIFSFRYHTGSMATAKRLMEKVSKANQMGVSTQVSIVSTKKNLWEVPLCAMIAYWYGARAIHIGPCMPGGMAFYNQSLCLSDRQFTRLIKIASLLDSMLKIPVYFSYERKCTCATADVNADEADNELCRAGKDYFVIGPAGGIRKCPHVPFNLSTIQDIDQNAFNKLWNNKEVSAESP